MSPIYVYQCTKCKRQEERQHPMCVKHYPTPCSKWRRDGKHNPECKGELVKIITGTSFVLKGGCWEKDGYNK